MLFFIVVMVTAGAAFTVFVVMIFTAAAATFTVTVLMLVFAMIATAAAFMFFFMVMTAAATFAVSVLMLVFAMIATAAAFVFFFMVMTAAATFAVTVLMLVFAMIAATAAFMFFMMVMIATAATFVFFFMVMTATAGTAATTARVGVTFDTNGIEFSFDFLHFKTDHREHLGNVRESENGETVFGLTDIDTAVDERTGSFLHRTHVARDMNHLFNGRTNNPESALVVKQHVTNIKLTIGFAGNFNLAFSGFDTISPGLALCGRQNELMSTIEDGLGRLRFGGEKLGKSGHDESFMRRERPLRALFAFFKKTIWRF